MRRLRSRDCAAAATSSMSIWRRRRRLKQQVVAEQLQRLAGITGQARWSRFRMLTWHRGRAGLADPDALPGRRSGPGRASGAPLARGDRVAAGRMPDRRSAYAGGDRPDWPTGVELIAAATSTGGTALFEARAARNQPALAERAAGRDWRVAADGFWQVHPAAAETLVDAVIDGLEPQPGERAFDLYCGVGLFAGALADAGCQVWGIESSRPAVRRCPAQPARRRRPGQADRRSGGSGHRPPAAPGRSGRAGPAALRRGPGGHHPAHLAPAAGDRVRGLRPGGPGARPRHRSGPGLRADQHPGFRSLSDDPPRRMRGDPHPGAGQ